jgi:carbamoylphosphate synthase large subunit
MRIPEKVERWVKLYHYAQTEDGLFHFPPHGTDEVGIVMGLGDTIKEAIQKLKDNLELLKDEPVSAKMEGFVDLLKEIEEAEQSGMTFTDQEVPDPATVLT